MSDPIPVFIVPAPKAAEEWVGVLIGIGIILYLITYFEIPSKHFPTYPSLFFAWVYHYTLYVPMILLFACIGSVWSFSYDLTSHSNLNLLLAIIFTGFTICLEIALLYISISFLLIFYFCVGFIWFLIWFVMLLFN